MRTRRRNSACDKVQIYFKSSPTEGIKVAGLGAFGTSPSSFDKGYPIGVATGREGADMARRNLCCVDRLSRQWHIGHDCKC